MAQQRLLIVLIDVTEIMIRISSWISCGFFSYPNYSFKIGFMTQHYVLENFHAPFKSLPPRSRALIMTSPLLAGNSLFVIQKAKLLHMNTVVNIAPRGLYFHGKVIGMLVVFLGYKILILIFFWVFWKVLCRNEILVFLGLLVFHIE